MDISIDYIVFIGIFLGLFGRTLYPYLKKIYNGEDITFELRFLVSAIASGLITAILVYNTFNIPEGTTLQIFIAAFIFAWGIDDVFNRIIK